jgi:lipoate-protein ligase A
VNCLDLTLPAPDANLALDEALLEACENGSGGEVLRFWEPRHYFVVVGYSNSVATEVNAAACEREKVGIYRRCSGGGTVLQGPGCLNYSLILKIDGHEDLQTITGANGYIMQRNAEAVSAVLGRPARVQGHTDLALEGRKFSGNAQRRKRQALLFHGTFLLDFDLTLMEKLLPLPSRQPEYRAGRAHGNFVTNIPARAESIKHFLAVTWNAQADLKAVPDYNKLLTEKYARDDWNLKL